MPLVNPRKKKNRLLPVYMALLAVLPGSAMAEGTLIGQSGLVNMPDARIEEEGVWRIGLSDADPYSAIWSSVTILPRLEVSARFTRIPGVPGDVDNPEFGDFRDKAFDAKLLLLRESRYLPAVSVGTQDFTGTGLFTANFVAMSKRIGGLDITLGYGNDRIDGGFGGLRYHPSWNRNLGIVIEHDANDYPNDFSANLSGADKRLGGTTYGLEYKFGWFRAQVSRQEDTTAANVYVSIPLMRKEFIPKIHEPKPYTKVTTRPALAEWRTDPQHTRKLAEELDRQGFKNIGLRVDATSVEVALTHTRISLMGRAVGRAARTLLLLTPVETELIKITYTLDDLPLLTYRFRNVAMLRRYFAGETTWEEVRQHIDVKYADPQYAAQFKGKEIFRELDEEESAPIQTLYGDEGHFISFKREDRFLSSFRLIPFNLRVLFNDPSGAARYDTFSLITYSKHFGQGMFLNGSARLTLYENVSDITGVSENLLPHVRTDVAEYKREADTLMLNTLFANKYFHTAERVYSRVSAGYYEEMFAGVGGQILYLPKQGNWAVDFSLDWVKQREPGENFSFRDYSVATALASYHYRFPKYGLTTTARVGRFLAKDEGVRFEVKRRFRSGVELGVWFTHTNEKEFTGPGDPNDRFRDKGLFLSIPLSSMLTKDTQERANLSLVEFTRDVGQMVVSPGDLYRLVERPLMLDSSEHDPLTDFTK